jgi:hypothetical protein
MTSIQGTREMTERPWLFVLDLLETYAREREIDVLLERDNDRQLWTCTLKARGEEPVRGTGETARHAIRDALGEAGVELPS